MRFASLGSGSRGNATLVESNGTCVLVDCGFSMRETVQRLQRFNLTPEHLTGILLTHEHTDHIKGAGALARKYKLPVWATRGTAENSVLGDVPIFKQIDAHQDFVIDAMEIHPFPVPHDAREPCQFVFSDGQKRLGLLTDVGCQTTHITQQLSTCDALLIECNHDSQMLAHGDYPEHLKERIISRLGHLSNEQAADLLAAIDTSKLQHIVAAHLSGQNNTPSLARTALSDSLGCEPEWVGVATQEEGLEWRTILT